MKVITPEKPGTELASFLEKKIQTRLGTSGSVISGKIIQKWLFRVIWRDSRIGVNKGFLATFSLGFIWLHFI